MSFGNTLRFGIYTSGFLPTFDEPGKNLWLKDGDFLSCSVIDYQNPMFPDAKGTAELLARQFPAEGREIIIARGWATMWHKILN